jgi:hypothetical protein
MKRRAFLYTCTAFIALAGRAHSASFADLIVEQLTQQGFADIEVETTWLGRVRIVASRTDGLREIILNPRTGEILRDLWTTADGQTALALVEPVGSRASSTQSDQSEDSSGDQSEDDDQPSLSQEDINGADDSNDPTETRSDDASETETEDTSDDDN